MFFSYYAINADDDAVSVLYVRLACACEYHCQIIFPLVSLGERKDLQCGEQFTLC